MSEGFTASSPFTLIVYCKSKYRTQLFKNLHPFTNPNPEMISNIFKERAIPKEIDWVRNEFPHRRGWMNKIRRDKELLRSTTRPFVGRKCKSVEHSRDAAEHKSCINPVSDKAI